LAKVRAIRQIAGKLITFLAQLEDFQLRLWTKKKFILETHYLVSIDLVPRDLLGEVANNKGQVDRWIDAFSLDEIREDTTAPGYSFPPSPDFLASLPSLMVDTRFFDSRFKQRLIAGIQDLDQHLRGVVIRSENSQALNLVSRRLGESCAAVYADPPYNTAATEILYKNSYKHSSWLSLMSTRLVQLWHLLDVGGVMCVTIDDFEFHRLRALIESLFGMDAILGVAAIKNNPSGRATGQGFSIAHEYAVFVGKGDDARVGRLPHTEEQASRYKDQDEEGQFEWVNFRKHGGANANRYARPKLFYPIFAGESTVRIPEMEWDEFAKEWKLLEEADSDEEVIYPVTPEGREKTWKWGNDTATTNIKDLKSGVDQVGRRAVYRKARIQSEGTLPRTLWDRKEYSSTEYGTNLIADVFGKPEVFPFPKSVHAVVDCLRVCCFSDGWVVDPFGGSATTAHAALILNREDDGDRKFLVIEMGDHVWTAVLPRIERIAFDGTWQKGSPTAPRGTGQGIGLVKILEIESYEDSLANLVVTSRTEVQQRLLESSNVGSEDYVLRYLLPDSTSNSCSMLQVNKFTNPFLYTMRVADRDVGNIRESTVDLMETFNWLLGLRIHSVDVIRGFHIVTGRLPGQGNRDNGEKALIIWRDLDENPNDKLDEFFRKQAYNTKDQDFDVIYVNGDNNLENLKKDDQTWKVRLIEEEFHRLMWDVEDV
jgi:adenine-specific DNA-methyltransferase